MISFVFIQKHVSSWLLPVLRVLEFIVTFIFIQVLYKIWALDKYPLNDLFGADWPWIDLVILFKNVGTDMVQPCSSPRGTLILMSGIWPWLTWWSFDFWMRNWPWLLDLTWPSDHGQPWFNHGQQHCQTMVNHGWPCSSPRGVLIWMSAHQVFRTMIDHQVIWFLNVELTMVAWINLTMVNHGSAMVKTLPDHGRPWFSHVHPPEAY